VFRKLNQIQGPGMAQIVCIIGNKGGTGKTSLTHMLSHGLGLLSRHAVAVLTDLERDPLVKASRRYLPFDARTEENLVKVVAKLKLVDSWIGVIDGGANRPEMDVRLNGIAALTLLPFRDSHEDIRTVRRDLERFPNAYALPSQWPTNAWQLEAAERSVEQWLGEYRSRLLEPVSSISASKLLLQAELPEQLPSNLNTSCRRLAAQVLELLGDPASKITDQPEIDDAPIPMRVPSDGIALSA
jgi:chromosome partitioning protein